MPDVAPKTRTHCVAVRGLEESTDRVVSDMGCESNVDDIVLKFLRGIGLNRYRASDGGARLMKYGLAVRCFDDSETARLRRDESVAGIDT